MDAVLAGDQSPLRPELATEDETVPGEPWSPLEVLSGVTGTLVLMNGTLGFIRILARWTIVEVPLLPLSLPSSAVIRSEIFEEMRLVRDSLDPSRVAMFSLLSV